MKKFRIVLLLTALTGTLILSGCDGGKEQIVKKLSVYPFNTAIVNYNLTGTINGSETLYIKGDLTADYLATTDSALNETRLDLNLGSEIYKVDMDKMTAVKVRNEQYDKLLKMSPEDQAKQLVRSALGLKDDAAVPTPAGKKEVAGQTCDFYIMENLGSVCLWNGIVLQKEISMIGITNTKSAVSVEVDVDIAKERFELPAGVIVTN